MKRQLASALLLFRPASQAAILLMRVCLSGMRRSRHCEEMRPSSDSARLSQLPCLGVEVVLHEGDFFGLREVGVGHLFEEAGVIDGGAPLGDLDMPPAFERRQRHEQVGRAVAPVFVVKARRPARTHRRRHARFGDKLPAGLVETNQRAGRVVRAPVDLQHIFHRRHEGGIGLGRDDPLPF